MTAGERNVEALRWLHDTFRQGGTEDAIEALRGAKDVEDTLASLPPRLGELMELIDPDIEIDARHSDLAMGGGGLWRGWEGWFDFWSTWLEPWDDFDFETSNFEAIGDHVLMDLTIRARGRDSGVPVEGSQTQIWTFREGRVIRMRPAYPTRAAAVQAARE
jgi:ketosteroid isomerase-like protein